MNAFSQVYHSDADFKANKPVHDSSGENDQTRVKQGRALVTQALKSIRKPKDEEHLRHHITIAGDKDAIAVSVQLVDDPPSE